MSVWETFSASLHMVQEKLEHVLEDSTTEEGGKVGIRGGGGRSCGVKYTWGVVGVAMFNRLHHPSEL